MTATTTMTTMTAKPLFLAALLLAAGGAGAAEPLPPPLAEPPRLAYNRTRSLRGQERTDRVTINAFHKEGETLGTKEVHEFEFPEPLDPLHTELLTFEVGEADVRAVEVIVLVAHGWEAYVAASVHTGFPAAFQQESGEIASTGSNRHVAEASCYHIFEECVEQRYSQYTLPPYVLPDSKYGNRMAFRVDHHFPLDILSSSMKGRWTLEIANRLPGGVNSAHVKIMLVQKFHSYWRLGGMVLSIIVSFIALGACIVRWENEAVRVAMRGEGAAADNPPSLEIRVRAAAARASDAIAAGVSRAWARVRRRSPDDDAEGGSAGATLNAPAGEPEDEEDEEMSCRICRSTHPRADLFSPCACAGSMQYIHRACLEEWRTVTNKPENKIRCSECKHPFTLQVVCTHKPLRYTYESALTGLRCVLHVILCETILIAVGFAFKFVMFMLSLGSNDAEGMVWDIDLYHHVVALHIVHAYQLRLKCFRGTFKHLFPNEIVREVARVVSLLLEIPAGYVGNYLYWLYSGCVWDWQVHYCKGFFMTLLLTVGISYSRLYHMCAQARRQEMDTTPIDRDLTAHDEEEQREQRDRAAAGASESDATTPEATAAATASGTAGSDDDEANRSNYQPPPPPIVAPPPPLSHPPPALD